ncbi:MAG: peptidylprolyl isomerase [Thermoanaerobaculia bacterium]|nr:peptidylprolyl isomerase [Thermoanaerobaculia bacterium]
MTRTRARSLVVWMVLAPSLLSMSEVSRADSSPTSAAAGTIVATWQDGSLSSEEHASWRLHHGLEASPEAIREQVFVETMAAAARRRGVAEQRETQLDFERARYAVLLAALQRDVLEQVVVSDEQVEALRLATPTAFRRPRKVRLSNIYRRFEVGADGAERTRQRMDRVYEELLRGGDFADLARRESQSQSRFRDGSLGFLDVDALPLEVATAVESLQPGQVTLPIEHGEGVSIFLCQEIRPAIVPTADEVRTKLRANLQRIESRKAWDRYQEDLLTAANVTLRPEASDVPLIVGDYRIDRAQFEILCAQRWPERQLDSLSLEERSDVLRSWALGILGSRRAIERGLDRESRIAAALRWQGVEILAQKELVRRVDERLKPPGEEELRREFAAHPRRYREPESFELSAIHFAEETFADTKGGMAPLDSKEKSRSALGIVRRLEAGELAFDTAARDYSIHPSSEQGGYLGWLTRRQVAGWGSVAVGALTAIEPGERTGLLHLESGLWIFVLKDRREPAPGSYEASQEEVRADLRRKGIQDLEVVLREEQLAKIGLAFPSEELPSQ